MASWAVVRMFAGCGLLTGCTMLLGIDEDYQPRPIDSAGGTSGSSGAGGSTGGGGSGGNGGSGGSGASGGTGGNMTCPPDRKFCPRGELGDCFLTNDPEVGCASDTCEPCPAQVNNAEAICNGDGTCGLKCSDGFGGNSNGECVPLPDGGAGSGGGGGSGGSSGGTGGSGGSGGGVICDPVQCPPEQPCPACPVCPVAPLSNCCLPSGRCGGKWVAGCFPCSS